MRSISRRKFLKSSYVLTLGPMVFDWTPDLTAVLGTPQVGSDNVATPIAQGQPVNVTWRLSRNSLWETAESRSGQRFIRGSSSTKRLVAASEPFPISPRTSYRMEGWIRNAKGQARIGWDFLDDQERVLTSHQTPIVSAPRGWTYVAVETS